jgi:hypothetical protein
MTIVAVPPTALVPDAALASPLQLAAASPAQSPQSPQALIEYLARVNPGSLAAGASPSQLGEAVVGNLKGFMDRSQSMTSRARALADPTPPPHASMTVAHRGPAQDALTPSAVRVGPQPARGSVDGHQMDRVIQALGLVFDYSIETQLVVRGATQVSGAANTLLRGQ